jgi:diguanylate cyclase (GGDEF)-like protein
MRRLHFLSFALFPLALVLSASGAFSQQTLPLPDHPRFAFQKLSEQLSLATATVTCMAQDQQGFLWIGTENGLFRYDGAIVTQFSAAQGLGSVRIDQMFISPRGDLWVATDFGVWRYVHGHFEELPLPAGHKLRGALQLVAVDSSDEAYVIVEDGGLLRINADWPADDWKKLDTEPVSQVVRAADDSILVAWKNKVGRITQHGRVIEALPGDLPDSPIYALLMDGAGDVWARTARHFSRWDRGNKRWLPDDAGIPGASDFGYPTIDHKGEILLPTTQGLYRRNHGHWEIFGEKQGMATNAVFAAIEDRDGAIWVGFGGNGVERWPGPGEWLGWSKPEGVPDSVVWAAARDSQRRLWVGTNDGLGMWDPVQHKWRTWKQKDGLPGGTVRSIVITSDDTLWALSVPGGIAWVDLRTLSLHSIKTPEHPESRNSAYTGIVAAPHGGLWAHGVDFIDQYESGQTTRRKVDLPKAAQLAVSALSFAKDGTLWGVGRNGVVRFDGKQWRLITAHDGLLADFGSDIWAVSGKEAWVTYFEPKGATRIRVGKDGGLEFKHYNMSNGLPSDSLYLVAGDHDDNVWLGGDHGLSVVHPDGRITIQDRSSGLLWNDVSADAFFEDADGGIFIGTSRGLAYRRPNAHGAISTSSPAVITSVAFAGKEMLDADNPKIPYLGATFEVHFSAPALDGPTGVSCKYQLHGLENDQVETTLRQVRYTALPSGNFTFEVSCGSASHGWSAPVTYRFSVLPPWWQRLWARAIFVVLFIWIIVRIITIRTRALERQRERLEQAIALRSAELSAANKRLEEASLTDPLTGVHNRRFFEATLRRDVQQTVRAYQSSDVAPKDRDLAFFLVDLDHFKSINDTYGHAVGDKVLIEVAQRLNSVTRETDVLVRWGGEEFLLVSQGASTEGALHVARRILEILGGTPFATPEGHTLSMTCSIGWATFPWISKVPVAVPLEEILKLADRALYLAKHSGRNRAVGFYPDEKLEESPIGEQKAHPKVVRLNGPEPGRVK